MRTTFTGYLLAALLSGTAAACVGAQADKNGHNCKKATQIVAKGKPDKKEEWAWAMVLGCGAEGGAAARDAWRTVRTATDTRELEALYSRVWSFRDAALFEAARSTLGDASATAQSRVYSAMLLIAQLFDRRDSFYGDLTDTGPYRVCRVGSVYDRIIATGTALPTDARQRARLVAQRVLSSASTPSIVQNAARCVVQTLDIDDRVQASKPIVPPEP